MTKRSLGMAALGWAGLLIGLLGFAAVAAAEPVATVIRVQGSVQARDQSGSRVLAAGDPVQLGDRLSTGSRARLEVHFQDGMELTLSDGAEMAVSAFAWNAAAATGRAELSLVQGAFLLQTGAVGKLPDHPLTVKTPLASVGVRGTRFWGGPLDAPLSVLLIEGRVVVSNATGAVELTEPGQGTSVLDPGGQPAAPSYWGDERVKRAFATVSFGQ